MSIDFWKLKVNSQRSYNQDRVVYGHIKTRKKQHLATKLKIYAGPEHPHAAQQPVLLAV